MPKYNTSYCFSAYDLFSTFNLKQLKIRRDVVQDKYGAHSKQTFCGSVLVYCFYLILLDIIENNVTFVLPLFGNKYAEISAQPVEGEDFKKAVQRGAFKGIDFLSSDFMGYKIVYS